MAEEEILPKRRAPQIQVAVLEPGGFPGGGLVVDRKRQCLGFAQYFELRDPNLDLPRRQVRVGHPLGPGDDLSLDGEHPLRPDPVGQPVRVHTVGGVGHNLGEAVAVAQIDEYQAAVVAVRMGPAHEDHLAPHVGGAKLPAVVRPAPIEKSAQIPNPLLNYNESPDRLKTQGAKSWTDAPAYRGASLSRAKKPLNRPSAPTEKTGTIFQGPSGCPSPGENDLNWLLPQTRPLFTLMENQ